MAAKSKTPTERVWLCRAVVAVVIVVAIWFFPFFHAVRVTSGSVTTTDLKAPPELALAFWREQLPKAQPDDAVVVANGLRKNAKEEIATHAHQVGLGGTAYFFVKGEGRVVTKQSSALRIALGDREDAPTVEIQIGLIFGNVVRDGTGLLDINRAPSLEVFNALSAELNKLVETQVLPVLREKVKVGDQISFAGCAEAVGPTAGQPLLSIVPVRVGIKP